MLGYIMQQLEDGRWSVIEKLTDQTIGTYEDRATAEKAARYFNLGGGFDGFTPSFILRETPVAKRAA